MLGSYSQVFTVQHTKIFLLLMYQVMIIFYWLCSCGHWFYDFNQNTITYHFFFFLISLLKQCPGNKYFHLSCLKLKEIPKEEPWYVSVKTVHGYECTLSLFNLREEKFNLHVYSYDCYLLHTWLNYSDSRVYTKPAKQGCSPNFMWAECRKRSSIVW